MALSRHLKDRRRPRTNPGAPPGIIVVPETAPRPRIDVIQFNQEKMQQWDDIGCNDIPVTTDDTITWVNVCGLGDKEVIETITELFNIHDLAAEDVVNTYQRDRHTTTNLAS